MSELPLFLFYPGAYTDGVFERTAAACVVCRQARGWGYASAHYGAAPPQHPCPWCVGDGRAAALADCALGALNEVAGDTDEALREEIANRTPAPLNWQDMTWPVHGGAPMIYEGRIDYQQVRDDPAQLAALRAACADEKTMREWVSRDGDINVMLFRSMDGAAFTGVFDAS